MRKYTKEEFLMAAKIGEVSMIDAKHIVSVLDEIHEDEKSFYIDNFEPLKQYLSDRAMCIDKEISSELISDNTFLLAYYNGVKVELKAVEIVIDALIEKQKVLSKLDATSIL